MFNLGLLTKIGFCFAIVVTIYGGSLFTKKNITRYLFGGTILTYTTNHK